MKPNFTQEIAMPVLSSFIVFIGLLFSQLSFGAACPSSSSVTSAGAVDGDNCTVTGSSSVMQLNFQNGFNDASVVTATGSNNGTTVGAQRKLSFIKAVEILADQVVSTQTIIVDANFDSDMSCNASSATLGSAGATTNVAYPAATSGLLGNTYYPIGLANAITDSDIDAGVSDITSSFNADLGDSDCLSGSFWYYGFDAPSGSDIGFTTVLLHEMTHGLGFASLTDASDGSKAAGIDDIFSNFLYSKQDSADWSVAGGLNDSDRADSAVSVTGLLWNGSNVNTKAIGLLTAGYDDADTSSSFTSGDRVQMYAPNPIEGGSSVSHFTTAASPNEIMEPQYTAGQLDLGLALYLLKDIGWEIAESFGISLEGTSYADGDTIVLPITSSPFNIGGDYSIELDLNGVDVSNLLNETSAGVAIESLNTGEFAGEYILTVTNDSNGDVITLTLKRPLNLNWSATSLLNGDTDQTLAIEGGASGTVYSLVQSGSADLVFLDDNSISITTATAENNATSFNAALIYLDSAVVTDISSMDVTVQSSYDDVIETGVKVYPASLHDFSVKNTDDEALSTAFGGLTGGETLLKEMNLATSYSADSNGEFTVLLPDTSVLAANTIYEMEISASGYNSETLTLDSNTISHNVVLTEASTAITLTGNIRTVGTQNLLQNPPVVELSYGDGTSDILSVLVASSTQASFSHEVDLNLKSLKLLSIRQSESDTLELNISNIIQTQSLYFSLSNNKTIDTTSGSSGGGSISFLSLFSFVILLLSVRRIKMLRKPVE